VVLGVAADPVVRDTWPRQSGTSISHSDNLDTVKRWPRSPVQSSPVSQWAIDKTQFTRAHGEARVTISHAKSLDFP
jgi:hypothetical protein